MLGQNEVLGYDNYMKCPDMLAWKVSNPLTI